MPRSLSDLPNLVLDLVFHELYTAEDGSTALKTLSTTNCDIRAAALPRIFSSVRVEGTLGACAGSMRDILASGALVTYVRSFTLRVDISEAVIHDYQTYYNDQTNTVTRLVASTDAVECAKALVTLLNATAMQGLRSLTVEPHSIFDTTFVAGIFNHHFATPSVGLDLGHITSLSTSTCCTVLAAACPSVTRLELCVCYDDDTGLTEEEALIWGAHTEVLYLTVSTKRVLPKLDRIQVMTLSMAHLTELSLPNGLRIRKDLQYLQHLQSLCTLGLGSIDGLGIEFNLPQCGFAWGQLERDPVRMAQLQADRSSALQETKRRVRSTFPRLERMILDGKVFDFTRLQSDDLDELDELESVSTS